MARKRNQKIENTTADNQVETTSIETTDDDIAAIEALLNGETDVTVEINDEDFDNVDPDELNAAIAGEEAKKKAYDAQDSKVDTGDDSETPEQDAAPAGTEQKDKPKELKGAAREMGDFLDQVVSIVGENPVFDTDVGELSEEDVRKMFSQVTQIKVREKVLNFLQSVLNGRKMINYTEYAVDVLLKAKEAGSPVTLGDIKAVYEAKSYRPGTVAAQAGQMMAMFPALGLVKRTSTRGVLELNENSVLLEALAG